MDRITILCSSHEHPIYPKLVNWKLENEHNFEIELLSSVTELKNSGNILFLISCSEIVLQEHRDLFDYTLVIHASDLPEGRGWSPHVWTVLKGGEQITVSLLDAADQVDTGDIWKKITFKLNGTELFDEINELLFEAELKLMDWASNNIYSAKSTTQVGECESYYRKRSPEDSQLDVNKSIAEQMNLLRVCDPNRFPAYFYMNNQRYNVKIEKAEK